MRSAPTSSDRLFALALLCALILILGSLFFFRVFGSFYFAGFVSGNLGHFRDDAVCITSGNLPYSHGFAECVATARKSTADTAVFEYPPAAGLLLGLVGAAGHTPLMFEMVCGIRGLLFGRGSRGPGIL